MPPGIRCAPGGVSGNGETVVGAMYYNNAAAVRWVGNSQPSNIGTLPGDTSAAAISVSTDGSAIVGWSGTLTATRAFRWTASDGMAELPGLPGTVNTTALAVSADGRVVAGSSGPSGQENQHVVRCSNGAVQDLGAVPGTSRLAVQDLSADGAAVVFWTTFIGGGAFSYRWTSSTGFQNLGAIAGSDNTKVEAISGDGSVAVGSFDRPGARLPFIWTRTGGIRNLLDILGPALPTGWTITSASDISVDGRTIVGYGYHDGHQEGWIATIPAPTPVVMIGLAFGLIAGHRRRVSER